MVSCSPPFLDINYISTVNKVMQVRTRRTTLTKITEMCQDYPDCEEM
nr:MAG TPA: hypothetical protein [Caudoviricetes sp.]